MNASRFRKKFFCLSGLFSSQTRNLIRRVIFFFGCINYFCSEGLNVKETSSTVNLEIGVDQREGKDSAREWIYLKVYIIPQSKN